MKLPTWIHAAAGALAAALLPACDGFNLQEIRPGITTQAEVRARLGEPSFIHRNDDGGATWEYNRQPAGSRCYMIGFGRDGIVSRVEQALNAANYARITPGLNPDQVRRILGAPGSKAVFANLGEEIWEWRIAGVPPIDETYLMVHFNLDDGTVRKTSQRIQQKGG